MKEVLDQRDSVNTEACLWSTLRLDYLHQTTDMQIEGLVPSPIPCCIIQRIMYGSDPVKIIICHLDSLGAHVVLEYSLEGL